MSIDLSAMSDRDLRELQDSIIREQALRRRLDASPEKIEHAIAEYQRASGKGSGETWKQPVTALDAYRKGAEVEHDGKRWVSTVANNVWTPGVSGWRLKPETDEDGNEIPPPYMPPTGVHDAYQEGERVTFDGEVYEAVRDGVVHSPAEYPADWSHVIPATPIEPADPIEPEPEDPDEGEDEGEDEEPEAEEPEAPEWEKPTGGHNAYNTGDLVTYEGTVYKSLMDGNTWSPSEYPQGWETPDA